MTNLHVPLIQVKPNEMQEVVAAYKDKGDANGVKKVQSTGLHVGGDRFIVIKADDRSVYGKKVRNSSCLSHCRKDLQRQSTHIKNWGRGTR